MAMTTTGREMRRLRKGIVIAWIVNFLILALTFEAAAIFIFLGASSTDRQIGDFLAMSAPICAVLSIIATSIAALSAARTVMGAAGSDYVRVDSGPAYQVVENVSIAAGIGMPEVYVMEHSGIANAYAVSDRHGSRIIITDTLMNMMTRSELESVVAHEVGHIKSGDSKAMTTLTGLTSITGIISGSVTRLFRSDDRDTNAAAVLLIIVSFLFLMLAPLLSRTSQLWMSRERESTADMLSVKFTGNPDGLISALRKLDSSDRKISRKAASRFDASCGCLAFHAPRLKGLRNGMSTHPPIEERIRRLEAVGGLDTAAGADMIGR